MLKSGDQNFPTVIFKLLNEISNNLTTYLVSDSEVWNSYLKEKYINRKNILCETGKSLKRMYIIMRNLCKKINIIYYRNSAWNQSKSKMYFKTLEILLHYQLAYRLQKLKTTLV